MCTKRVPEIEFDLYTNCHDFDSLVLNILSNYAKLIWEDAPLKHILILILNQEFFEFFSCIFIMCVQLRPIYVVNEHFEYSIFIQSNWNDRIPGLCRVKNRSSSSLTYIRVRSEVTDAVSLQNKIIEFNIHFYIQFSSSSIQLTCHCQHHLDSCILQWFAVSPHTMSGPCRFPFYCSNGLRTLWVWCKHFWKRSNRSCKNPETNAYQNR